MRHTYSPEEGQLQSATRVVEVLASGFNALQRATIADAVDCYWQVRANETDYPDAILVASQLKTLNTDTETLVAALLGSESAARAYSIEYVRKNFGDEIAELTDNVRRLNTLAVASHVDVDTEHANRQTELLRRMLLAMVTDVRAVLVKLAFRTQRLHNIVHSDDAEKVSVARDSLDIYSPLANRLGVGQLKWEMEDLAFRIIDPDAYKRIAKALEENRAMREGYIRNFVAECEALLHAGGMTDVRILGRPKHIYSIWRKMRQKRIEFKDLFDVRAVRVLVDDVSLCYQALGVVHNRWQPVAREFDDYIANPKENGYQSLHTAVVGPGGKPVEIQIRTHDMDRDAELGVASHWLYKEADGSDGSRRNSTDERMQKSVANLRQLLQQTDDALIEGFTQQFNPDRVYVFTPKGDVVDMVAGSTPLDFAYHVHSEIGHRCRGAKINGSIVPLTSKLGNGDRVEVLTTREAAPSRDWLNRSLGYLHTSRARSKVRVWFNARDYDQHVADGKVILDREMRRLYCSDLSNDLIAREMKFDKLVDLHVALGRADISAAQVATKLSAMGQTALKPTRQRRAPRPLEGTGRDSSIQVRGVGNLLTQLANCCQPVPYDSIVGFITRGKGVTIHRSDCSNMLNLREEEQERLIEVEWGDEADAAYQVEVLIIAFDRQGLLRDVSTVLADQNIDLHEVNTLSKPEDQTAEMRIRMSINQIGQLSTLTDKLRQLRNILSVNRVV